MSALTEQERKELADEIREELESEHRLRLDRLRERKDAGRRRASGRSEDLKNQAIEAVREQVRQSFYEEQGYKLYTDSTGRQMWLPAEEHEWRMRRSSHRRGKRAPLHLETGDKRKVMAAYVVLVVVAVVVGVLLVR